MTRPAKQPLPGELHSIRKEDNAAIAAIIRAVLTEFGCTAPGFAIHDPEVDRMYETYQQPKSAYFVMVCDGKVIGGGGLAPLAGTTQNISELQKFYILPEYRGRGFGHRLLDECLKFARKNGFNRCYIETVEQMQQAESLYHKIGFERIPMPLGNTGHHACNRWYMKIL